MSQGREPDWQDPEDEIRPDPAALDSQLAGLVAYCRAVTGRDEEAVSTARAVLDSAQSLLSGPDQLRAWLFALARMEILAGSQPQAREVFDLVHVHGIRLEDLPVVLSISPAEADELLAAAEAEYPHLIDGLPGGGSPGGAFNTQFADLVAYCRTLTGQEEDAVSTAHSVLGSARSLLADPDLLRAWLFALARREMLADAAPGSPEIIDLIHQHGIRAEDLPIVLGIPPAEADDLLAAAEEEYASRAFGSGRHEADPRHGEDLHDDRSWDDRAAAWHGDEGGNDESFWAGEPAWADEPAWAGEPSWAGESGREEDPDWDETFGPKKLGLQNIAGPFRRPSEQAGRHAAPGASSGGLRHAFSRGPVRVAAAAGIVVAVIGVSGWYLAASDSPPPSQAGQQTKHHPAVVHSPSASPSPSPSATPTRSPSPSQPFTAVPPPPAPAPTSPRPSPKPSPKPSPSPSPSPSSSPSPSPSPSASTSPA